MKNIFLNQIIFDNLKSTSRVFRIQIYSKSLKINVDSKYNLSYKPFIFYNIVINSYTYMDAFTAT